MNDEEIETREQIIVQALSAETLAEIELAAQALRQWIQQHPDDLSAEDALEPLALRRQGLHAQAAQEARTIKTS